jgi:hypothetical protein
MLTVVEQCVSLSIIKHSINPMNSGTGFRLNHAGASCSNFNNSSPPFVIRCNISRRSWISCAPAIINRFTFGLTVVSRSRIIKFTQNVTHKKHLSGGFFQRTLTYSICHKESKITNQHTPHVMFANHSQLMVIVR